jgi:RimJ/RimL family protein N-acetyltransferase
MIELRSLTENDAEWITEACQDAEILRWTIVPRPYTLDHAKSFVNDLAGELMAWAISDPRSPRGLGVIGVHHIIEGAASIGYWVAPWARQQGAATIAIRLVVAELRTWPDVTTVSATIATTNTASRRTAESAGMSKAAFESDEKCPDGDSQADAVRYECDLSTN